MTSSDKLKAEDASISQSRQQGMDQSASSHGDAGGPADVFPTQGQAAPQAEEGRLGCAGCGIAYEGAHWLEIVLTNEDWTTISPTGHEGGVLCANCIASRLSALGRIDVPWMLTAGPLALCHTPPPNTGEAETSAGVCNWRPLNEAPEHVPILAQYHEWNDPTKPLAEHVVWFINGAWREYPNTSGDAYIDRWKPLRPALTSTRPNTGEEVDIGAGVKALEACREADGYSDEHIVRCIIRATLQQEPRQ